MRLGICTVLKNRLEKGKLVGGLGLLDLREGILKRKERKGRGPAWEAEAAGGGESFGGQPENEIKTHVQRQGAIRQ